MDSQSDGLTSELLLALVSSIIKGRALPMTLVVPEAMSKANLRTSFFTRSRNPVSSDKVEAGIFGRNRRIEMNILAMADCKVGDRFGFLKSSWTPTEHVDP